MKANSLSNNSFDAFHWHQGVFIVIAILCISPVIAFLETGAADTLRILRISTVFLCMIDWLYYRSKRRFTGFLTLIASAILVVCTLYSWLA